MKLMKIDNDKVKRILIFKLCCIGDTLMMTPSINALKENFPEAEITLISSPWIKGIIENLKNINSVIITDVFHKDNFFVKVMGVINLIISLRKKKFDMVFLGHRNNAFGWILMLSGIRYRLGFCQTRFINYCTAFDENIHEMKRYLNILESIGIDPRVRPMELTVPQSSVEIKKKYDLPGGKSIIGIFPFGGINPGTEMTIKRWGLQNYFELIKLIQENFPDIVILLFDGSEKDEQIPGDSEIFKNNQTKKFKIDTALISVCDIFISSDTGPLHIAAGLNASTLSIFGPTDPGLLAPLNSESGTSVHRYIWKKPYCSPCFTPAIAVDRDNKKYWRGRHFICHTGTHICIKEISVEEVYSSLNEIINKTAL